MAIKLPSIPEPGNDPASQLNTLRAIKQVVDLLAANATGDKNTSGPSVGAQIFALQDDVKQLMKDQTAALTGAIDQNKQDATWTVEQAVSSLNQDISDARNRAIQARSDALTALDTFEASVAQTVLDINSNINGVAASVKAEAGARSTADDAQAGRINKAVAFMGLNEASWKEGDVSVATRFNAMSTGYKSYVAKTNDDFLSSYTSFVATSTDLTSAIATQVNNLETKLTVTTTPGRAPLLLSSAVLSERNSTSDATKQVATAQDINTIQSNIGGSISAAVKVESDARAQLVNSSGNGSVDQSVNKLKSQVSASYGVTVTAVGGGKAITGFQLVSDASTNNAISDFAIFADKFRITNGSATKTPFSIDASSSKIRMSSEVDIDGNLVVTGTIDAPQIKNNSISDNRSNVVSGTEAIVTGVNLNSGDRVIILGTGDGGNESYNGGSGQLKVFFSNSSNSGGASIGSPVTAKAFCRSVGAGYGYTGSTGTYLNALIANYALPPAAILRTFTATQSGSHNFSVVNSVGGDTAIALIRLSR